jgi:hypothetical protein
VIRNVPGESIDLVDQHDIDSVVRIPASGEKPVKHWTCRRTTRCPGFSELFEDSPSSSTCELAHRLELRRNRQVLFSLFVRGYTGIDNAIHGFYITYKAHTLSMLRACGYLPDVPDGATIQSHHSFNAMPSKTVGTKGLRTIFGALQDKLLAELKLSKKAITHPGTKGSVSESRWRATLGDHLPARYCATQAFVIDSKGAVSEQIDLVIYDRQYSPFILNQDDAKYVTAESVYGVFEIKPTLNATTLKYAAKKIASVRRLHRTSAPIPHAGGVYKPKPLTPIIGGILSVDTSWRGDTITIIADQLARLKAEERLQLGCILAGHSFEAAYSTRRRPRVSLAGDPSSSLVFFFLSLLAALQDVGTVAAIDLRAYSKRL